MRPFPKHFLSILFFLGITSTCIHTAHAQYAQQGNKLVGSPAAQGQQQGAAVALSADGNTALIGANGGTGGAFVWIRTSGTWSQQGPQLVGSGAVGAANQGVSVALSADGNTAIVGGNTDNNGTGAAWVFVRTGSTWAEQQKVSDLSSTGAGQGVAVALSADGNTALIGGNTDGSGLGAVWVWTRGGSLWTQQGPKLVGSGASGGFAGQGSAVALSGDGNTAIWGGKGDAGGKGAVWVFTRTGGTWTQQGSKLVTADAVVGTNQGGAVALSADGSTALVGGAGDGGGVGAAWVMTRTGGTYALQAKLVGASSGFQGQGSSVALSSDGSLAVVGAPDDGNLTGATWVFTRSGANWSPAGPKLVGSTSTAAEQGFSVAVSGNGQTILAGGPLDSGSAGAAFVFVAGSGGGGGGGGGGGPHFVVSAPSSVAPGTPFNFTVTALDASNATITNYSGLVHFTSSDGTASLPGNSLLSNGTGTFSATLNTTGTQSITATDTANAAITGTSNAIAVGNGSPQLHFSVTTPASVSSGTSFNFVVTALDASNALVPTFSGIVHFTSTDGQAILPANASLTGGSGNFSATLKTVGSHTITATDIASGISGSSNAITVGASALHFSVSAPATAVVSLPFTFTVTARDANNATLTSYSGTVHFSSSDGQAVLPANTTLVNGTGTFPATLKTPGNQTIQAQDVANGTMIGNSGTIAVSGGATHFSVTAPATAAKGASFSFTVTALDASNETNVSYGGTVHFTSTDSTASLPANVTLTNGTGTFAATLNATGNHTITATDVASASITGTSGTIATRGAAAHFVVNAPEFVTASSGFLVTVTAKDADNATAFNYSGTIHFTSSDTAAELPADATLTNGVGNFPVTLKTTGSQTVSVTDTSNSGISGVSPGITVRVGAVTQFVFSVPASAVLGAPFNFTVSAQDAYGNTNPNYAGTVHFNSTDGAAVLPANSTLTNGTGTFQATLKTAGPQKISAVDTSILSILGTSSAIAVSLGGATHFVVTAPATAVTGTAFNVTVTALDAGNNVVSNYGGTIHFASTDALALLPANTTLTNGTGTFAVTLRTSGNQSVTVTDTVTSSISGTSTAIATNGTATHFAVSAPGAVSSGVPFNFTVTAQDNANGTVSTYAGTVHFTSSDGQAVLPANATLTNGTGTFSATLKTTGNQTITATDTANATITGNSGTIAVGSGAATHFSVSAPATATAGSGFTVTVTALDGANNVIPGYTGTVHLTSSDAAAVLPANATLTNGTGTFSVTLKTAGNQTVAATDTVTAAINGVSGTIAVAAGTATHLGVTGPAQAGIGTAFNFTVKALDAFNNVSTGYTGTVHFVSSDTVAVLPANATLTNGTGTFSATLKTAGNQSITVNDTATPSINGTSGVIAVANAATHFSVTVPATAVAGTPLSVTVTALDAGNNTVQGYTGTVHFTSSDGAAILPANGTLTNGTGTFAATFKTAGNQTITATDTANAASTGSSNTVAVAPGAASRIGISAPATLVAGAVANFTATAFDAFNNPVPGYAGTLHFTSTDALAGLPPDSNLTNGTGTFAVVLRTAGGQTITASDKTTPAIGGSSAAIVVTGGAATHFGISAPSSVVAGTAFNFTVNALDAFNNVSAGYAGTVKYTSSDGIAVLPGNGALTNGTATLSATLKSAGAQTITATDTAVAAITGTSGAINVGGGTAPVSAIPGSGTGTNATLMFTFTDPRGYQDLDVVNILINSSLDGRNACYLAFSQPSQVLYLVDDGGGTLSAPLALTGSGSVSNSQCTVSSTGSSIMAAGNNLTLTLNVSFTAAFSGYKVTYLAARDQQGGNSGWQALGTWQVPGAAANGPQPGGVTPARSSGSGAQAFTFTFNDSNGWQDLGVVNVLVNDFLNGNNACYLAYSRADNVLYLVNNAGSALSAPLVLNGAGSVSNSQCTVTGAGSSAFGGGNTLTLTLNITFNSSFAGNRIIYMAARSNGDAQNSGWQAAGTRTIQ